MLWKDVFRLLYLAHTVIYNILDWVSSGTIANYEYPACAYVAP